MEYERRKSSQFGNDLFPKEVDTMIGGTPALGQVVAGGPIYPKSNIMLSYMKIFSLAREKLYITNPYFIPNESIVDSLCQAAISGVNVRLLVPEKSDSAIVGAAARFYFSRLLDAGARLNRQLPTSKLLPFSVCHFIVK